MLTKPDSISGRRNELIPSSVKKTAIEQNIPIYQPLNFKSDKTYEIIQSQNADFMVVAAYGLIIPQRILSLPKNGCLNIHGSLLPRWRGAAPIQRALMAGDKETGVTIIQMNSGLDTGDMLLSYPLTIENDDTTVSLYDKLAIAGAACICETIDNYSILTPQKQDDSNSCYAEKLTKTESKINWNEDCFTIERKIRGYNPMPGAFTTLNNKVFKIWKASVWNDQKHNYQPGEFVSITNKAFFVACSTGIISLKQVQLPGSKKLEIHQFLQGYRKTEQLKFD